MRIGQRVAGYQAGDVPNFGRIGFQEFEPGGKVVKQVLDAHARTSRCGDGSCFDMFTAFDGQFCPNRILPGVGDQG